ncbi:type II toxin-antitoxin system RelE family toxin [Frigidibacter mobilis]|uniref:Addiction module antitoxin n=1 Tax=Frigidibacter mobilis TaxID=1335048 RepID=A0A159Z9G1_9RHOB|nr:type II toxin-antitoxin system RelE/ParE family toxin [Frigidibacter mobilis]AMY71420.1 addiction module antitoxin [Frigidibacter mobilis]
MSYELQFLPPALEEWRNLNEPTRLQFKKKLGKVLENPRVPKNKLRGAADRYKIKLRSLGYRLVYEVSATSAVVTVIAVGKRDKDLVYRAATKR